MKPTAFRRASLVVLTGTGAGFVVNLLLTPVVTRMFGPAAYGLFAATTAWASAFVGVSTFRYEVFAQREADEESAQVALRLATLAAACWGIVLTVVAGIGVLTWRWSLQWLTIGPLVVLASMQLIGTAELTRRARYRQLATANFVQNAGLGVIQVLSGLARPDVWALLAGFGGSRLIWLTSMRRKAIERHQLFESFKRSYRFAAIAGLSAAVNSLAGQLPILLTAPLYGEYRAGLLAIGLRVLVTPLGVVGQAAAAASMGEIGRHLRERDPNAQDVLKRGMRDLLILGAVPCGLAGAFGAPLAPWLLGSNWRDAGIVVSLLSAGALAQFAIAPFSQILNLAGRNRHLLAWDLTRFALVLLSMALPRAMGLGFPVSVAAFSASQVLLYGWLARACVQSVGRPR